MKTLKNSNAFGFKKSKKLLGLIHNTQHKEKTHEKD
jgi:hypothetical protein